jgi:hypothetical protein
MSDKKKWWENLDNCWSEDETVFLTSGKGIDPRRQNYFMGDFVFHRFFGSDDYDVRDVKVVLVELKNWTSWQEWFKTNKTSNSLLPLYVHNIEQVLISRKSFRIVKWVDEYRPFDICLV